MYRHILVPLDGSETAARAVSHAVAMARAFNARVTLLHVVTPSGAPRRPATEPETAAAADDLQAYLEEKKRQMQQDGVPEARWLVTVGDPATEVVRAVREQGCDLLVMSTHGRGSSFQWVFGSVASKVLNAVSVPVVLLRAPQALHPLL